MEHRLALSRPLAVFDLETTGVSVGTDRIVEIAILVLLPDGGTRAFEHRVNPEMPIPPGATAVHGISDADVALEPTFRALAPKVRDMLKGCDLSGYNVRRFDLPMLVKECERAGAPLDLEGVHVIDVQTIFHQREPRDLSAALRYYCGREHAGAHGALADVRATADVLQAQLDRYDDLPREIAALESVVHPRNPDWVDDDGKLIWENGEAVFTFGKLRGQTLRHALDTDARYIDWMINGDFPPSFKAILGNARRGFLPRHPSQSQDSAS